jgi:hypothetical protein
MWWKFYFLSPDKAGIYALIRIPSAGASSQYNMMLKKEGKLYGTTTTLFGCIMKMQSHDDTGGSNIG